LEEKMTEHRSIHLEGGFSLSEPIDVAFPLFSPLGEKAWVPGWEPELIHPPGSQWAEGLMFRTPGLPNPAIWVVARLENHHVRYNRYEMPDLVVSVDVECKSLGERSTAVTVGYSFVSLTAAGDEAVAAMSERRYEQKMRDWKRLIEQRG
jgi:hypothetical protein